MNTICMKFSLIKKPMGHFLNFTKSLGGEGCVEQKTKCWIMKGSGSGLSSRKSSVRERERTSIRYYFQLFFKLEQRKKTHTHTHKLDMIPQVYCWKGSPCLYWSKVLKISKEQIYWFWGSLGVKKRKNKEVLFARSVQMTSQVASLMVGEGRGQVPTRAHGQNCPRLQLMVLAESAVSLSFLIANFLCARRQTDIDWSKCPWVDNIWNENPQG